jgi:hypothetical protein
VNFPIIAEALSRWVAPSKGTVGSHAALIAYEHRASLGGNLSSTFSGVPTSGSSHMLKETQHEAFAWVNEGIGLKDGHAEHRITLPVSRVS